MNIKSVAKICAIFVAVSAFGIEGMSFEHGDWKVACDNTGTCRVAGFQADSVDSEPISILFTILAGKGAQIDNEVQIFAENEVDEMELFIDDKFIGALKINNKNEAENHIYNDNFKLTDAQTSALIDALHANPKVELKAKDIAFELSPVGFNAVWLKMNEFQGRLKGQKLLTPRPMPVIKKIKFDDENGSEIPRDSPDFTRVRGILKALPEAAECFDLVDEFDGFGERKKIGGIWKYKINDEKILVQTRCYLAAYNESSLLAVMDKRLEKVYFASSEFNEVGSGEISGMYKDRGFGDCWNKTEAVWDGEKFVKSSEWDSGPCKGIAGGAWVMPTFVSEVVE